ncbi:hypothetical protein [Paenibacillus xylanexedens]|uniref:hypothetical protein n=1 Tax=Paenibacillus xylanexedens TaxID=528191 RepID=UPI000F54AB23|nr:hypothetical protein [Paenibacillus xylanexedens]RPK23989.1 hypothetical protein EDO6_04927 [Paenibacillus xylanexedens]
MTNEYKNNIEEHIDNYKDFISWCRWNPDLWYDLITPETGAIKLDLDQRVFLRCITRFVSTYGVFPRGWSKTMLEVMGMVHCAIFFPDIEISMTAQTQSNASDLLKDKWYELVKFYPLLKDEITKPPSFTKDNAEIHFKSGGRIDVLANAQSSKGQRRKRLQIEESALLNNKLYEDVLEPIPNVPRRTIGKEAVINPQEMNGQINFFTTAGFRGTDEYERSLKMVKEMIELKGKIVLGSDWQLAVNYGRGEPKSTILSKKENNNPTFFAQNYESKWVGSSTGALVDIRKLLELRTLKTPELSSDGKHEYILSVDVARSLQNNNNETSVVPLKLIRNSNGKIIRIQMVNLINFKNGLNFKEQGIQVKRIRKKYNASAVVVDGNGLGTGLIDELLREVIDPETGENLECWDTINDNREPEISGSPKYVYNFLGQTFNSNGIVTFMDMVESKKLELLEKDTTNKLDDVDYAQKEYPFIQTDRLIEEVSNLKLKPVQNNKYSVEQVVRKINKDRYSALMMGLWYIDTFLNKTVEQVKVDPKRMFLFKKANLYGKEGRF